MRRVVMRRMVRHAWGADRQRVVLLVAIAEPDGTTSGEVWGSDGQRAVQLEAAAGVTVEGRRIRLADGVTVWAGDAPGCSCKVPRSLKGFDPTKVAA